MQEALVTSGAILAFVVCTQYGRRRFSWHKWLPSLVAIPVVGFLFLRSAPTSAADLVAYAGAVALGAALGAGATIATRLERDPDTGQVLTVCGVAFVVVWAVALGARVAFIWALLDNPGFQRSFGMFMVQHHIGRQAIAPTFVLTALTMLVIRVVALLVMAPRSPTPAPVTQPLASSHV